MFFEPLLTRFINKSTLKTELQGLARLFKFIFTSEESSEIVKKNQQLMIKALEYEYSVDFPIRTPVEIWYKCMHKCYLEGDDLRKGGTGNDVKILKLMFGENKNITPSVKMFIELSNYDVVKNPDIHPLREDANPLVELFRSRVKSPLYQPLAKYLPRVESVSSLYPEADKLFKAMELTPDPKEVVFGQDPYAINATGIAFGSVFIDDAPPSLRNIEEELAKQMGHGIRDKRLYGLAKNGILFQNICLVYDSNKTKQEENFKIWTLFTRELVKLLLKERPDCIFVLWGTVAKNTVGDLIPYKCKIEHAHPSPLSKRYWSKDNTCFTRSQKMLGYDIWRD
jgi:uracil-DNA glycosylase